MFKKNLHSDINARRKPVVLMTMGAQERKGHDYQVMTNKYIKPLVDHAGCVPMLVPTCCGTDDIAQYLAMADGVYLTGAGSNIDPTLYQQENLTPEKQQDRQRDNVDIAIIHMALEMGLPVFAICRGMQEINVALGGDLHQKLYAVAGMNDHRENSAAAVPEQYAAAHNVSINPMSWFAKLLGQDEIAVNSLHGQAINRLGKGVQAIAHAEDGCIEAIYLPEYSQFTLGVQWHPEWEAASNPYSVKIFAAFGYACRIYAEQN